MCSRPKILSRKEKKEVLDKKLPLTLIHEGVGRVIYDAKGEFKKK